MSILQRGRAQAVGKGVLGDEAMQSSTPGMAFPWLPPLAPLPLRPLSGSFVSACCPLPAFCSLDSAVRIQAPSRHSIVTWGKLLPLGSRIGEEIAPISEGYNSQHESHWISTASLHPPYLP